MNHCRRIVSGFLIIIFSCLSADSYAQKQRPRFKVQVDLVSLDVVVLDRHGNPINGLSQNDFVVKENGSAAEISNFARLFDLPVSLVVSLETSFMSRSNLAIAKNTISQLIHLLKPEDEICLYSFDQKDAYLEQSFTRERYKVQRALDNIGVLARSRRPNRLVRSFTAPPQAGLGVDLGLAAAKKGIYQRKAVLLIRDRLEKLGPASLDHLRESGCSLIALGFSEKERNRLMFINNQSDTETLVSGSAEMPASDENGNVTELCRAIAHLLTSRYSITYRTSLTEGHSPRQIEVLVPGYDYRILVRRSYVLSEK